MVGLKEDAIKKGNWCQFTNNYKVISYIDYFGIYDEKGNICAIGAAIMEYLETLGKDYAITRSISDLNGFRSDLEEN